MGLPARLRQLDGSTHFATNIHSVDRVTYLLDENGNDFLPPLTNPGGALSTVLVKDSEGASLVATLKP